MVGDANPRILGLAFPNGKLIRLCIFKCLDRVPNVRDGSRYQKLYNPPLLYCQIKLFYIVEMEGGEFSLLHLVMVNQNFQLYVVY
jgi:hypothetical protein